MCPLFYAAKFSHSIFFIKIFSGVLTPHYDNHIGT